MTILGREMGHALHALVFLSRLPVRMPLGAHLVAGESTGLGHAARYFPLAGCLIGLILGGLWLALGLILAPALAAGLVLGAGLILTGALHEDGLADCADGLGGAHDRARALDIMRDSRIGTYGAAALICSLGLRWQALVVLGATSGAAALIIAHTTARGAITLALATTPYARSQGAASQAAQGAGLAMLGPAMVTSAIIAGLAGGWAGLGGAVLGMGAGLLMLGYLRHRLGGYTGDGLGAIEQIAEIAVLISLAGLWS